MPPLKLHQVSMRALPEPPDLIRALSHSTISALHKPPVDISNPNLCGAARKLSRVITARLLLLLLLQSVHLRLATSTIDAIAALAPDIPTPDCLFLLCSLQAALKLERATSTKLQWELDQVSTHSPSEPPLILHLQHTFLNWFQPSCCSLQAALKLERATSTKLQWELDNVSHNAPPEPPALIRSFTTAINGLFIDAETQTGDVAAAEGTPAIKETDEKPASPTEAAGRLKRV